MLLREDYVVKPGRKALLCQRGGESEVLSRVNV